MHEKLTPALSQNGAGVYLYEGMFDIKHRYSFIILLAFYSYLDIIFSEVDRHYQLPGPSLVLVFFLLTALIWETNRIMQLIALILLRSVFLSILPVAS